MPCSEYWIEIGIDRNMRLVCLWLSVSAYLFLSRISSSLFVSIVTAHRPECSISLPSSSICEHNTLDSTVFFSDGAIGNVAAVASNWSQNHFYFAPFSWDTYFFGRFEAPVNSKATNDGCNLNPICNPRKLRKLMVNDGLGSPENRWPTAIAEQTQLFSTSWNSYDFDRRERANWLRLFTVYYYLLRRNTYWCDPWLICSWHTKWKSLDKTISTIKPNFTPDSDRNETAYLFRLFVNEVLVLIGTFRNKLPVSFGYNI